MGFSAVGHNFATFVFQVDVGLVPYVQNVCSLRELKNGGTGKVGALICNFIHVGHATLWTVEFWSYVWWKKKKKKQLYAYQPTPTLRITLNRIHLDRVVQMP